jgi:acetyl esterase/lipase
VVVLHYSVYPDATYPTALLELGRVVLTLSQKAEEWLIDSDKIVLMGFSAGGHLAGCTGTLWEHESLDPFIDNDRSQYRPDKLILSYPVLKSTGRHHDGSFRSILGEFYNEESLHVVDLPEQVKDNTPPSFIWHTFEDNGVPVDSSIEFGKALLDKNILFEMHIYPHGGHGLCLDDHTTWDVKFGKRSEVGQWIDDAIRFIFDESIIYKS